VAQASRHDDHDRCAHLGRGVPDTPGALSETVASAVEAVTGRVPVLSTTGGTSDARFVKNHCPVVEFGLVGHRMHEVDERVWVQDIHDLKAVYARIMADFFAS
jgi:succinyl-diaminopimelate desuccinylase